MDPIISLQGEQCYFSHDQNMNSAFSQRVDLRQVMCFYLSAKKTSQLVRDITNYLHLGRTYFMPGHSFKSFICNVCPHLILTTSAL